VRARLAAFAAVALVCPSMAGAQHMIFTPEEVDGADGPTAASEAPPSEVMANALRLYQQRAYREAAVQLERVASGGTLDGRGNVQRAEYYLGVCLFHLGFHQTSLSVFEDIVEQGRAHAHFDGSLPWLAQLGRHLPEPAGVTGLLGHYGDSLEVIRRFDSEETRELHGDLLFLMGRHWYDRGELGAARRFFVEVPPEDDRHYEAHFYAAVTHVRERRAAPAVRILRGVLDRLDRRIFPSRRERRYRDLAWLTLARIYYSARHWDSAIEAWSRVPPTSEYWLDALFEQSWARFQTDGFGRALGNVHTLGSPYFDSEAHPEALVLRAVIYFEHCQFELAEQAVVDFQQTFQPIREELAHAAPADEDRDGWLALLGRVREGRSDLSPRAGRVARDAMTDRTLLRHLEYLRVLGAEEESLGEMPSAFSSSALAWKDVGTGRPLASTPTQSTCCGPSTGSSGGTSSVPISSPWAIAAAGSQRSHH